MSANNLYRLRFSSSGIEKSDDGFQSLALDLIAERITGKHVLRKHFRSLEEATDAIARLDPLHLYAIQDQLEFDAHAHVCGSKAPFVFNEVQLSLLGITEPQ